MKTLIFVAMVVGSVGFAETSPQTGSHGPATKSQTSVVQQPQAPKKDAVTRLNEIVNACLVSQGSKNSSKTR